MPKIKEVTFKCQKLWNTERPVFCGAWISASWSQSSLLTFLNEQMNKLCFNFSKPFFKCMYIKIILLHKISILYIFQYEPPSTSLQTMQTKHCKMPFQIHYKILEKIQKIKNFHIGPKHIEMGTYIKIRLWYKYDILYVF